MKHYRWGIIGPGKIAEKFANTLEYLDNASLGAVASRDIHRAKYFANKFGCSECYGSYDELFNADIDVVYIATPHSFHHDLVLRSLQHRKPVLCEKPMALSHSQVTEMVQASRNEKTFLMEAMWSRFIPTIEKAIEWISDGAIGELKYVRADFGFESVFDPQGRLYNLRLGGGSLLDVGVYPVFLAVLLLGEPIQVEATAHLAETGADTTCQALLQYTDERMAQITSSVSFKTGLTAEIAGTKGIITLDSPWYKGHMVRVVQHGSKPLILELPLEHNGFEYQVREVMSCLDQDLTESPRMPRKLSLQVSTVMDRILEKCGIQYPGTI